MEDKKIVCEGVSNIQTVGDFLVWPTGCNYYFYLTLLLFLMAIIGWYLYKSEEKKTGKADFIASAAVSSIVITILALIGTFIKNSSDIPMIQADILLIFIALMTPLVLFWIFKDQS